jgi:cellulose synthase/poly-beta-1,6-N-acetylglucosamine synthase-like glycosyltransferase
MKDSCERLPMDISEVINIIFFLTLIIPILTVTIYGAIILYYGAQAKKNKKVNDEIEYPDITILIPSYNEEKVMEKRIQNILDYDYPKNKMKVIFIDDSADSTPLIIQKYVDDNPNLELLRLGQRSGYSKAVFSGLSKVETDLVVLNEAGSFPLPGTLKNQIIKFENPEIGAVTGHSVILNTDEKTGKIESLYLDIINFVRSAESEMDTTIFIKGEATAYRTQLVKDIEAVRDTGSIDTSMAFMVRKKGYKTVYGSDVIFEEYAPSDDLGFRKQKMIRAANIMRNLLIYKEMLLNPKYGKFGMISMPFYMIIFYIIPVLLPISILTLLMGVAVNWSLYKYILGTGLALGLILLLVSRNLLKLLMELEISILKAIYQIFVSKKGHDKIERVESTRRT